MFLISLFYSGKLVSNFGESYEGTFREGKMSGYGNITKQFLVIIEYCAWVSMFSLKNQKA